MAFAQEIDDRKVVIDACAAIKLQRLDRLGTELFTTSGVLREVKDEKARALLDVLPMELKLREPSNEDLAFVKQFAKATGDFGFLSQNDMELIALTVHLHKLAGGSVREKPEALTSQEGGSVRFDWAPQRADRKPVATNAAEAKVAATAETAPEQAAADAAPQDADAEEEEGWGVVTKKKGGRAQPPPASDWAAAFRPPAREASAGPADAPSVEAAKGDVAAAGAEAAEGTEDAEGAEVDDEGSDLPDDEEDSWSEDGSSAGEWVTEDNLHRFGVGCEMDKEVKVTCATADYSVQNVLLQIGITPLTFDGYAVRTVKLWGLICRGCFHFTRESHKVFCPKCGNATLVRVPIVVGEDGKPTALNSGRKLRTKGTIFSMPKPQMGRGPKPILAEDEMMLGGRDREQRRLENLHNKERQARDPFNEDNGGRAWYQRGTTATGKQLHGGAPRIQAGWGRRNPNANNFGGFGRKKK